jgi:ATP-dependent protease ClpP protease subunit
MIVTFDDSIELESFLDFQNDLIDALSKINEDEEITVYFSTCGGSIAYTYCIYDLIKKYEKYIKIVFHTQLASAGFLLLYLLRDSNIYITDISPEFMIHKVGANIHTNYLEKENYEKELTAYNKKLITIFKKLGLSEKNIEKFNRKEDVYLKRTEVLEMFPNLKTIKYI